MPDAPPPHGDHAPRPWRSVGEASALILAAFSPLPPVPTPLDAALGLVLAETVVAGEDLPPFANAAMDGFAVRAVDITGAGPAHPVSLRVAGMVAAGAVPRAAVAAGTAVRIMTGAPLPPGADAVVRFEETDDGRSEPGFVAVRHGVATGTNVRPAGEDVAAGGAVLLPGARIFPAEIGLLAALGRTAVRAHPRPRVAILTTGDELVPPGSPPGPGQIRDSNGPALAALVRQAGGVPLDLGIARDTTADLRARLAQAAGSGADVIVTVGGVSAGDYDLVKEVLRADGRIDLWQVRIKPGKPLAFGWLGGPDRPGGSGGAGGSSGQSRPDWHGGLPLIGLPGNPVAAIVAFHQFVRPAIRTMLGRIDLTLPELPARLLDRVENPGGRRHFVRVLVWPDPQEPPGRYVARVAGPPGAGRLSSLVAGNGLLVIPEDRAVVEVGDVLPVQMPDWDVG